MHRLCIYENPECCSGNKIYQLGVKWDLQANLFSNVAVNEKVDKLYDLHNYYNYN